MQAISESDLLAGCRQGDAAAWTELVDRHYAAVGRFLYQLAPDFSREDVEEICQDAFVAAIRNLRGFRGHSRFQTWLFRIAANRARDHRARHQAAKRGGGIVPFSLQAEDPETGQSLQVPTSAPAPDAVAAATEDGHVLRRALDQLGEPCREIIELRYFGDLSYEEISRALQLNLKTVSSRLSKCLDRLGAVARPHFQGEPSTVLPSNL